MTGLWAFIAPLVGVVLCVLGLLLAAESGRSRWLLFLAAVLFSADLVLVLRQRRRLTGRWIGVGGSTTGARARARHLSVLAAFCLVGFYALTWSAEQEAGIWTLVPAYALLVTFLVLMVAVGFSMITALQTREEDVQRGE